MKVEELVPEAGNLTNFIGQFEVFARAPSGVEKLREIILQLAVMGKLVPQNSNDKPSALLIEHIKTTKKELLKIKAIGKQSIFLTIPEQNKPFKEPKGWSFVRLGEITNRIGSGSTPRGGKSAYTETGVPFFRSQNVWNDGLKLHDVAYIPEDTHEKMSNTAVYAKDILLNITGASLGRCLLIPNDFEQGNVSQHVTLIRATEPETRQYLHLCILSPHTQNMIWKRQVGMAREGLSKKVLEQFEIPLPPLEEQKRIVAKVDELMALCDKLEAQQQQQANYVLRANTAAINALLNPSSPETSFEQNWQRIAQHFNTLYGCALPMPKGEGRKKKHLVGLENVKALRQVILQLAVTGKLIPQDSNDKPAKKLIDDINSKKIDLITNKIIGKQSIFLPILEQDKPFKEPRGWGFIRLGEITNRIGSGSTPRGGKSAYTKTGIPFFRSQNVWNDGLKLHDVAYIPEITHEKMSNTAVYAKDILLNITGASLGRCTLIPDDFEHGNVSQHVTIIRATEPETRKFLHLCILSPYTQNMIWKRQVGMAREGLSKKVLEQFEIPLPPLEEQKRIVAKVDQLMTLCDQLEQQLTQSYSDAEKLMQATVKALVA